MPNESQWSSKCKQNKPSLADALESDSECKILIELSPETFVTLEDGRVVFINRAGAKLLGVSGPKAVIGTPFMDYVHPSHREKAAAELRYAAAHERSVKLDDQIWVRRDDGSSITVEVVGVPIENNGKRKIHLFCRDITEQRKMELSLRENELRYRRLLQKLPEAIAIHSGGIVVYVNDAAVRLMRGEEESQLVGRSLFDFVDPNYHNAVKMKLSNSEQLGVGYATYRLIRLDGATIEAEVTSSEVFQFMDQNVIQTVLRDVTEREKREQFLRQSDKLQAIGQLAAGIAHEIRNPLTTLMGFTKLMLQSNKGYGQYSEVILSELTRISDIVNEFLTLSKPQQASFNNHHPHSLLQTIVPIIESQAHLVNVDVCLDLDHEVPLILCDQNQVKQVFINIMKNAIEAMADGGGVLTVSTRAAAGGVMIRVQDTGPGIPKNKLSRLGEPYYTTKTEGNGLGIMMCYKIIQAHGGSLHFDSEPGAGTTVTVTLPCEPSRE